VKNGALKILLVLLFAVTANAAPREKLFPDDRTLGNPNAPVVLVEYFAPMCPHCAHFAATVFPEIKKAYIDTGKVLYVMRVFPLGAPDGAVSGMAKCLKPERYYEFLDLAFKKQAMWDPDGYDIPDVEAALVQLGGMAGLKPDDAKRWMQDQGEFDRLNRLADDAVKRFDIHSVPSIVLDGKVLTGGDQASWPALKPRIDAMLVQAAAPQPTVQAPAHHKLVHHKHHKHHKKTKHPVQKPEKMLEKK
jgi:protein-disulfide isomerase